MFSYELRTCLDQINTPYYGVYPRDRIPRLMQTPAGIIVNTDPHSKPGTHWVAIYVDEYRRGAFFDSYGRPPLREFASFMQRNSVVSEYSHRMLQDVSSNVCGEYCVLYLYYRSIGVGMSEFLDLFSSDTVVNDNVAERLFDDLFTRPIAQSSSQERQSCCSRQRTAYVPGTQPHWGQYTV